MKWAVKVEFMTIETIVVEADMPSDARRDALEVVAALHPEISDVPEVMSVTSASSDARLRTYTCEFCAKTSVKEAWGPGRTTCPGCGKRALTAEEAQSLR